MKVRHAVAGGVLGALAGFCGGIWFVATGLAFEFIAAPAVAPAGRGAVPVAPPPPLTGPPRPDAVAVPKVVSFTGGSAGLTRAVERADLVPAPGSWWEVAPRPWRCPATWSATNPQRALGAVLTRDGATNAVHFYLTQSTRQGEPPADLRPVFFDEAAHRFAPKAWGSNRSSGAGGTFQMTDFVLAEDPARGFDPGSVRYFGVERVVPGADLGLAQGAQKEAAGAGIAILPTPTFGAPYKFDLPTVAGGRVRSDDFRGKVLAVVVWGPTRVGDSSGGGVLLKLGLARKKDPPETLAVVGVSFDALEGQARKAFKGVGGDDALVVVPNDPESRRLWVDGAQLDQIPVILLVDREGVLRASAHWADFDDRLDALFGRPSRRFGGKAQLRPSKARAADKPAPPKAATPPTPPAGPGA